MFKITNEAMILKNHNYITNQKRQHKSTVEGFTRFLSVGFFHQIAPPGPIRGKLGLLPNIHGDIRIWNHLCGVRYTTKLISRSKFWKKLSSYSLCFMMKLCITGFLKNCLFKSSGCLHLCSTGLPGVCILHHWMVTQRCKIHHGVTIHFIGVRHTIQVYVAI